MATEYKFAVNPNKLQRAIAIARSKEGGVTEDNVKTAYLSIGGKCDASYMPKINDLEANIKAKEVSEIDDDIEEMETIDKSGNLEAPKKRGRPFKNA